MFPIQASLNYVEMHCFILLFGFRFGQSPIQISTERLFKCDIFSEQQNDSSYCNYYITDFTDTVYFKHDQCLFTVILTSPTTTFKRKTQNGYAEGTLKIYTRYEGHYSVEEGSFSDGIAIRTHYREYYDDGTYKTAGQDRRMDHGSGVMKTDRLNE